MSTKIRYPKQAGSFYAGSRESLKRQIDECFTHILGPGEFPELHSEGSRQIVGLVCPHAGYTYSGPVAANAYYSLSQDGSVDTFVILGPNHQGVGSNVSIMDKGKWRTPLGDAEIDAFLAEEIIRKSEIVDIDETAHSFEHSIEVQLPFLQYVYGSSFKFVPICFLMQDLQTCMEVGESLAETIKDRNAVIIASTDLTHYESQKIAAEKDRLVIDAITKMDADLLYSVLENRSISACGYGPVATLLTAAKKLNAEKVQLLKYATSGDVSGDFSSVVGYASLKLTK